MVIEMGILEDIAERVIRELEELKEELEKEAKQRRVEGENTEDMYLKYKLFHEAEGIKDAIKKVNKRIQEQEKAMS